MTAKGWRESLAVYAEPAAQRMFFFGFSSGLPLLLILGTLSFWLRESGVDLKTIGFLSWVGLVYGFKWAWSPLVDRFTLPVLGRLLGRRRSWLALSQAGVASGLLVMASTDPAQNLTMMTVAALCTAWCSATQDIALDAYRIESAAEEKQAALAATYQTGYRIAMIWAGAGALAIAAWAETQGADMREAWRWSYGAMAASALLGLTATLLSPEPESRAKAVSPRLSWSEKVARYVVEPFSDFFRRYGKASFVILALIATYRISDVVMGIMANPFYQDMGFTKAEVAAVSKVFGVVMTLVGAFVGGVVAMRFGTMRTLALGAILACGTNLLFVLLSHAGHDVVVLAAVVSADNLAGGLASSAFLAYLSGLTSREHTATQYALFSSLMLLLPKFLAGFSGVFVEWAGYAGFFTMTAAIGVPVFFLTLWAAALRRRAEAKLQISEA